MDAPAAPPRPHRPERSSTTPSCWATCSPGTRSTAARSGTPATPTGRSPGPRACATRTSRPRRARSWPRTGSTSWPTSSTTGGSATTARSITQQRASLRDLDDRFATKRMALASVAGVRRRDSTDPRAATLREVFVDRVLAGDLHRYFAEIPGCDDAWWELLRAGHRGALGRPLADPQRPDPGPSPDRLAGRAGPPRRRRRRGDVRRERGRPLEQVDGPDGVRRRAGTRRRRSSRRRSSRSTVGGRGYRRPVTVQAAATHVAQCYVDNAWLCGQYWSATTAPSSPTRRSSTSGSPWCRCSSGLVVAIPLALLARRNPTVESLVVGGTTIIYTIPSLALFSLLLPFTGLSATTVIIGLALYSLTILVRNVLAGLRAVPAEVVESARGRGLLRHPAAHPGRAAAGAAGHHGRAPGGHRLDGRPGDGRLDRVVRRPRQPAAAGRQHPVQGADPGRQRALRRPGRRPRPGARPVPSGC